MSTTTTPRPALTENSVARAVRLEGGVGPPASLPFVCLEADDAMQPEQAALLKSQGAKHVCDASASTFLEDLTQALVATGANVSLTTGADANLLAQRHHLLDPYRHGRTIQTTTISGQQGTTNLHYPALRTGYLVTHDLPTLAATCDYKNAAIKRRFVVA